MERSSKKEERLGVCKQMNCGEFATIIDYKNANHMRVKFDNGIIIENVTWSSFQKKEVRYNGAKKPKTIEQAKNRLGEKRLMHCGVEAEIIEYKNSLNVTIRFTDGSIKKCRYKEFVAGEVQCPSVNKKHRASALRSKRLKDKRLHLRAMMNCGMECEIIEYHGTKGKNIVVQFDDGIILKARWRNFANCSIHNPNLPLCLCNNNSKGETKIRHFLERNNIEFIRQKGFDDLRGENKQFLPFDFYLPTYRMLIEYQGEFHDGTPYKKNPNGLQTKEKFEAQQERDKRKREYAQKNNIRLLEIWYWDRENIEDILRKELAICL